MQKSINQSNVSASSERSVLILLFLLGLAGILFLFTRSTQPDLRDLTQSGQSREQIPVQRVATLPRR
jgi:hypothetical protein